MVVRLRESCEQERLSLDTFSLRLEHAYAARTRAELDDLVADLPAGSALGRATTAAIARLSRWSARVQRAWSEPRLERLTLPVGRTITLGRSRRCDCVLVDPTISRLHATLRVDEGRWWLDDLSSFNGTRLNGRRILHEVEVRAGDCVSFGAASFTLSAPG